MRRREFLLAAGLMGTSTIRPSDLGRDVGPAAVLARRLESAFIGFGPTLGQPTPLSRLQDSLKAARADFAACRYRSLSTRLAALILDASASGTGPDNQRLLAQAYNVATGALSKLDVSGLEWISADRAFQAAKRAGDPLVLAESCRMMAVASRRAGSHERALTLTTHAAGLLDLNGRDVDPRHLSSYGLLMCTARYTAAKSGDRDQSVGLLAEAADTVRRLTRWRHREQVLAAHLVGYRVSSAYWLGDAGTGLGHARNLDLALIPTTERRARFLVDVALCFAQWDWA